MKVTTLIVGIDPDLVKSGYAVWSKKEKRIIEYGTYSLPEMIEQRVKPLIATHGIDKVKFLVEAGWINVKSNFRLVGVKSEMSDKVSKDVGQNQGTGKQIVAYLEYLGCNVSIVKPTLKGGDKKGSSYTPQGKRNFEKTYGFKVGQINDEERDAIAVCYGY